MQGKEQLKKYGVKVFAGILAAGLLWFAQGGSVLSAESGQETAEAGGEETVSSGELPGGNEPGGDHPGENEPGGTPGHGGPEAEAKHTVSGNAANYVEISVSQGDSCYLAPGGKWYVEGDNTLYKGGITYFATADGVYRFYRKLD